MNCSALISCFIVENPTVFSHQVLINCVASGSFWTSSTLAGLGTLAAAPDELSELVIGQCGFCSSLGKNSRLNTLKLYYWELLLDCLSSSFEFVNNTFLKIMKYWRISLFIITTSRLVYIQPRDKCYRSWPSWQFLLRMLSADAELLQVQDLRLEFNVQVWLWSSVWYLAQERDLSTIYLWMQTSARIFRHFSEVTKWNKFFPCYFGSVFQYHTCSNCGKCKRTPVLVVR